MIECCGDLIGPLHILIWVSPRPFLLLLLQQRRRWFAILVHAYPDCVENWPLNVLSPVSMLHCISKKTVACLIVYKLKKLELIFIIFGTHPNSPSF